MPRETYAQKLERMTQMEREYWARGRAVAGIDEVGRGPLVGPVVAACVLAPPDGLIEGVDDSKKLSEKRREALYGQLLARAIYARTAQVSAARIDEINILNATREAMEQAAAGCKADCFFVDALGGLNLPGACVPIVHGDALSYRIAAASIVAKVTRDRMMVELDARYPMYGFARNKGYGTAEHIAALRKYGPCPEHRRSFIRKILSGDAK